MEKVHAASGEFEKTGEQLPVMVNECIALCEEHKTAAEECKLYLGVVHLKSVIPEDTLTSVHDEASVDNIAALDKADLTSGEFGGDMKSGE